jgi:hypothetical protein
MVDKYITSDTPALVTESSRNAVSWILFVGPFISTQDSMAMKCNGHLQLFRRFATSWHPFLISTHPMEALSKSFEDKYEFIEITQADLKAINSDFDMPFANDIKIVQSNSYAEAVCHTFFLVLAGVYFATLFGQPDRFCVCSGSMAPEGKVESALADAFNIETETKLNFYTRYVT